MPETPLFKKLYPLCNSHHDLLNTHIKFDIEIYQRSLGELVMLLNQLLAFLELKNKEEIEKHWDTLAPLVFNSFSE